MSSSNKYFISGFEIIINKKGQFFIKRRTNFVFLITYYYRYIF